MGSTTPRLDAGHEEPDAAVVHPHAGIDDLSREKLALAFPLEREARGPVEDDGLLRPALRNHEQLVPPCEHAGVREMGPAVENRCTFPDRTVRAKFRAGDDRALLGIPVVLEEQPPLALMIEQKGIGVIVARRRFEPAKTFEPRVVGELTLAHADGESPVRDELATEGPREALADHRGSKPSEQLGVRRSTIDRPLPLIRRGRRCALSHTLPALVMKLA